MFLMLRIIFRICFMIIITETIMTFKTLLKDFYDQLNFNTQSTFKNLN